MAKFNDANWRARTTANPNLHSDFAEEMECPKGDYTLTVEKLKDLFQDQKHKVREMIARYNQSGNGSDMRVMRDHDSDIEDLDAFHGGDDDDDDEDEDRPRTEVEFNMSFSFLCTACLSRSNSTWSQLLGERKDLGPFQSGPCSETGAEDFQPT